MDMANKCVRKKGIFIIPVFSSHSNGKKPHSNLCIAYFNLWKPRKLKCTLCCSYKCTMTAKSTVMNVIVLLFAKTWHGESQNHYKILHVVYSTESCIQKKQRSNIILKLQFCKHKQTVMITLYFLLS